MKLNHTYVKRAAKEFLEVLDIWDINSCKDLEGKVGSFLSFEGSPGKTKLTLIPKETYLLVYNLRGVEPVIDGIQGVGIPLVLHINPERSYSYIFLKSQERIEGYIGFKVDTFYNIMQVKELKTLEFPRIKEELAKLCE